MDLYEAAARFQSTRPARGATGGMDLYEAAARFQSTRPARGATEVEAHVAMRYGFQSTRPARGATIRNGIPAIAERVSIHAPRAGRDFTNPVLIDGQDGFNPRAPRGARRSMRT